MMTVIFIVFILALGIIPLELAIIADPPSVYEAILTPPPAPPLWNVGCNPIPEAAEKLGPSLQ